MNNYTISLCNSKTVLNSRNNTSYLIYGPINFTSQNDNRSTGVKSLNILTVIQNSISAFHIRILFYWPLGPIVLFLHGTGLRLILVWKARVPMFQKACPNSLFKRKSVFLSLIICVAFLVKLPECQRLFWPSCSWAESGGGEDVSFASGCPAFELGEFCF